MATLEVFNGNDQGYNAIAKIDRNTIAINQELGSALPKTDIINNLISTDTTKALAATQGKILDDKISILKDATLITNVTQIVDGIPYKGTAITGMPTTDKYLIQVIEYDETARACMAYNLTTKNVYKGTFASSVWTFNMLATTDKIDILNASLSNGWINHYQQLKASKIGNILSLNGIIKDGVPTVGTIVGTLPDGFRPLRDTYCHIIYTNGSTTSVLGVINILSTGVIKIVYTAASSYIIFDCTFDI